MKLFYDLEKRAFVNSLTDRRELAYIQAKRGDLLKMELFMLAENGGVVPVSDAEEIVFAAKQTLSSSSPLLVFCDSFTYNPTTGAHDGDLSIASAGLQTLVGDGEFVDLKAELNIESPTLGIMTSNTVDFRAYNDVWKGTEGSPLELPDPNSWLDERGVRYDKTQTLNPTQQSQARYNINAETAGAGATAQSYAVQRANHTGTQAISTVTGLQTALDSKETPAGAQAKADAALAAANAYTDANAGTGSAPIVISANKTAVNDEIYHNVANATYTDPSPSEGKGYEVFIINGTATIGGTAYSEAGTIIKRVWHSGSWQTNRVYLTKAQTDALYGQSSSSVGLMDRFPLRADGALIQLGATPEIGPAYQFNVIGNAPRIATTGGLVGSPTDPSLFYMGSEIAGGIKSMTIEVDFKYISGGTNVRNQLTMAFSASNLLVNGGNAINLPLNMIHVEMQRGGIAKFGINTLAGSASFQRVEEVRPTHSGTITPWTPSQTSDGGMIPGKKFQIRFEFQAGECRLTAFGLTHIYRDNRIVVPNWWFYECEGTSTATQEYPTLYRIWANAPSLDSVPGWGGQQQNQFLQELCTNGPLVMPHTSVQFSGNVTAPNVILGNGGRYTATPFTGYGTGTAPFSIGRLSGAELGSVANSNPDSNVLLSLPHLPIAQGNTIRHTIVGSFQFNTNIKRIKVNNGLIPSFFDTGDLTTQGGTWRMEVLETRNATNERRSTVSFHHYSSGFLMARTNTSTFSTALNMDIKVGGVSANDVTIHSYFTEVLF